MREISTKNLNLIGKGVTASVYALDDATILKVFRAVVPKKDIDEEYACANLVNSLGISTPAALEMVRCGDETGIIYDRVHGPTLAEEIKLHPGAYYDYGIQYGAIVRQIHSKSIPNVNLPEAASFMARIFENPNPYMSDGEREELLSFLRLVPDSNHLLHGDISPVNLMVEDGRLVVIDVPTIMKGHPVFDLLQPYAYCKMTPELYERYLSLSEDEKASNVGKFMARFGARYLNSKDADLVWDGFFHGYFGPEPNISKKDFEDTLRFYNAVKLMGSIAMGSKFGDEVVRYLVEEGRSVIKELRPSVIGRLPFALNLENYK